MSTLSVDSMRDYLRRCINSGRRQPRETEEEFRQRQQRRILNKVYGINAERALREYLRTLNFANRVSVGGWLVRSYVVPEHGRPNTKTIALFPAVINPAERYAPGATRTPTLGLHTICSTFQQMGISSYFCSPTIGLANNPESVTWQIRQLGVPAEENFHPIADAGEGFKLRRQRHNFLNCNTPVQSIPDVTIPEEFSIENLRVSFQNTFVVESSDIDGLLWGKRHTYPVEVKEKEPAKDDRYGHYFGLDVGPFAKLAFLAGRRGYFKSLFIVKEVKIIRETLERQHRRWWYITLEDLLEYARWESRAGGTSMMGMSSAVVPVPVSCFNELDEAALESL